MKWDGCCTSILPHDETKKKKDVQSRLVFIKSKSIRHFGHSFFSSFLSPIIISSSREKPRQAKPSSIQASTTNTYNTPSTQHTHILCPSQRHHQPLLKHKRKHRPLFLCTSALSPPWSNFTMSPSVARPSSQAQKEPPSRPPSTFQRSATHKSGRTLASFARVST